MQLIFLADEKLHLPLQEMKKVSKQAVINETTIMVFNRRQTQNGCRWLKTCAF